jgi:putative transcriptional regulator
MVCAGGERVVSIESLLRETGFTVSQTCCSRPSCFDFAARKGETVVFIKLQPDIGSLSASDSEELRTISESVLASSILIGEKTREKPLEEDTVYSRYGILAVTSKTFESIVARKVSPLIQAGPGGYYVEVQGEAIKRRRQELGLSVGEVAEIVGVSRRTLYGYERGLAKASVAVAYNMIYALGIPVGRPVNVFEKPKARRKCFLGKAKSVLARNRLLQRVFRKLARYNIITVNRAPFDFVISVPEERMRIIGGVAGDGEHGLSRRVDEILSVSRVVRAHPILISAGQTLSNKDINCIYSRELSKFKEPEDLLANFR